MGKQTNLAYLMSLLRVRGVEISKYIHVDQSLVGKWKNGSRSLGRNSAHAEGVAEFFLVRARQKLEELFFEWYGEEYRPAQLKNYLISYLCEEEQPQIRALWREPDASYSARYFIYNGSAGRKQAMRFMLENADVSGTERHLFLYDRNCFSWLLEDNESYVDWLERMLVLLKEGLQVHMIVDAKRDMNAIARLLHHLYPLRIHRNFTLHYEHRISYPTVYVLEGSLALVGYDLSDDSPESMFTLAFTDTVALQEYQRLMRKLLKTNEQIRTVNWLDARDCYQNFKNFIAVDSEVYMFSAALTIYSMTPELLEKVFSYNQHLSEETKNLLRAFNQITTAEFFRESSEHPVSCIFSPEELERLSQQEYVIYTDNLYANIATLQVRQVDFRRHLAGLKERILRYDNYQIGLLSDLDTYRVKSGRPGYLAAKKQCWAIITDENCGNKAMFSLDADLADLNFYSLEYTWKKIPDEWKDKNRVAEFLDGILRS
ncbi:MAG: hypothetical protein E7397_06515 [Ruminococcaceae bacterium]|nr:hypothetical protein [Oscillospiraceae bacterium]